MGVKFPHQQSGMHRTAANPVNPLIPEILIQTNNRKALRAWQDDCKVYFEPLMVSLSNHERLAPASFDKLRTSSG